jgi:hypothetical protein
MAFTSHVHGRMVAGVVGILMAIAAPRLARAEQFTFFNFEYEATVQNTEDAHYNVRPPAYMFTQPNSWKAPIDYTQGTVYIEQDVLTKPSMLDTQVDICFISTGGRYGCRSTEFYKTTGRVTTRRAANSFYQFAQIDFTRPITHVQLIVKDRANTNGGNPKSSFMPTRMRIAMTFVSAGAEYTPPPGFAAAAATDGGAAPGDAGVADAAAAPADAEPPPPKSDAGPPPPVVTPPPAPAPGATPPTSPPPAPPVPMSPVAGNPQPIPASAPSSAGGCHVSGPGHGPTATDLLFLGLLLAGLACLRRTRPRR